MRARRLLIPAVAVATILALAGCTFGTPSPSPSVSTLPTVRIESPGIPAELKQQSVGIGSYDVVAPSGSRPGLLATSRQEPGKAPTVAVFSSTDGQNWTEGSFRPGTDAALTSVVLVQSADLVALAASSWKDGAIRPVLWTSKNGSDWSSIALPSSIGAGFRIADVALVGTTVVVVASNDSGDAVEAVRKGSSWTSGKLPTVGKGLELRPRDLMVSGDRIALVATPAKAGGVGPLTSWVSGDRGRTWSNAGVVIADRSSEITGATGFGAGFVVTGSQPAAGSSVQRPMAWSSADGTTWSAEPIPEPAQEGTSSFYQTADAYLDAPVLGADGRVAAVLENENSGYATVWVRGAGWSEAGETSGNSSSGEAGSAFTLADGSVAAVLGSGSWARAGRFSPSWNDGTVFAARNPAYAPDWASVLGDQVAVPVSKGVFTLSGEHWTNKTDSRVGVVAASRKVTLESGVPAEASGLRGLVYGGHGDSAVALGFSWPGTPYPLVTSGFATADGKTWTPVTGFPGDGNTEPYAVDSVDGRWVAVLSRSSSTVVGTPSHGAVYVSKDGVSWTPVVGDFGSGDLESSTSDVCLAPDGSAVAIGWVQRSANEYSPAAWRDDGGSWSRVDLGKLGTADGYLSSCAGDGSSLTVQGTVTGRSTLLTVSKKGAWSTSYTAKKGDTIGSVTRVSGGFVASGEHASGGADQAVVWLSRTGRSWVPVAVPSLRAGQTDDVAPLGKDLVVVMDPTVGSPIAVVRGIASVIAERTG